MRSSCGPTNTTIHVTYTFYDGEPSYAQVREEAKQVLAGKHKTLTQTTFSSPQPIPGEE